MRKCEICGWGFVSLEKAIECESQGIENQLVNVGDLVRNVETLDEYIVMEIKQNPVDKHYLSYTFGKQNEIGMDVFEPNTWVGCNDDFLKRYGKLN